MKNIKGDNMKTEKAKELLLKYGSMSDLTDDELGDIIRLLEQGEKSTRFLERLNWNTIYEAGKIYLVTRVKYFDINERMKKVDNKT